MATGKTYVILGAGPAGAWAATTLRSEGFDGRVVLVGEETWRPYERPPLSKAWLTDEQTPEPLHLHAADRYDGIDFVAGRKAVALSAADRSVTLDDGRTLGFDKLLIATGGSARRLPVPGGDLVPVLRTIEDAAAIRARLAGAGKVICIGAGVIGMEIAASAAKLGRDVLVLEAASRPLGRCVTPEIADRVTAMHRAHGVRFAFDAKVDAVLETASGFEVVSGDDRHAADFVVAGVGMNRNLGLAVQAGLAVDGGILVDEHGRTSVEGIYAAGDVAAFRHPLYGRTVRLESWRHAQNHGISVAKAMLGQDAAYRDVPWFWTDQYDMNLQVAGLPEESVHTVVRDAANGFTALHFRADGTMAAVAAANNPRDVRALTDLIRLRVPVPVGLFEDPATNVQQAARELARARPN